MLSQPPTRHLIITATILALGILLASWALNLKAPKQEPAKMIQKEGGEMSLERNSTAPLVVGIFASSNNVPVEGYDAVIIFDPSYLKFEEAEGKVLEFQVFPAIRENKVYITGTKKLGTTGESVFKHTQLVDLRFTALKKGSTTLKLEFQKGSKADSNIINNKAADILEKVENLDLKLN